MAQNDTASNIKLHVLIVGAGIAGLAAARAFRQCGHSVEIFERSKFANEIGAAVTISPNGTRVLQALDFDFAAVKGADIRYIRGRHAISLLPLYDHDTGDAETQYGFPHQAMHRQDLHSELLRLATEDSPELGELVGLHKGVKITSIDVGEVKLETEDGRVWRGDFLVGADGLHSDVRAAATGRREEPIDTEWQIYRFLLPREKVMDDEVMRGMKVENSRVMYDVPDSKAESKSRFVWYECRGGEVQNFAGFYRGEEDETKVEDFGNLADKNTVLRLFGHFNPKILHIMSEANEILYWRVYERPPLPTFTYGRTILIGDAGHAMSPFTAAGATQALEDAGAFLGLFADIKSKGDVERRIKAYDRVRLVRASRIQAGSTMPFKDGRVNPLAAVSAQIELLDEDLPVELKGLGAANLKRNDWDFRYDVFKKCREVLAGST